MLFVAPGKTDPGGGVGRFVEQLRNCLCFKQTRNRFTSQNIRTSFDQRPHTRTVEVHQLFLRQPIIPAIFRAICKEGAVWAHRRGDEWFWSPNAVESI